MKSVDKITITVDPDYVSWGIKECIRDLVQNAIDGQTRGHPMKIVHDGDGGLIISNERFKLPVKTLLMGYSTKRGDIETIGQWGEGLKFSVLGFLKNGISVKIINADEIWIPRIERSELFDSDLLVFDIHKNDKDEKDLIFVLDGISSNQWSKAKEQFLMFDENVDEHSLETPYGRVIDNKDYAGAVYVGGILVQKITDEPFEVGYNLKPGQIKIDRDRKMIDRHALKNVSGKAWVYLANNSEGMFSRFETMLKKNSPDVQDLKWTWNVGSGLIERLHQSFIKSFGDNAIPVLSHDQVNEANMAGKTAFIFGEAYVNLIQDRTGTIVDVRQDLKNQVKERFEVDDLDEVEGKNLFKAWQLLTSCGSSGLPELRVVEFNSETIVGLYSRRSEGSWISLSRTLLKDFGLTLEALVHEYAHSLGGTDGSMEHISNIEKTWRKIVEVLIVRNDKNKVTH